MQIVIDIPDRIYKRQGYLNIIDSDILRNALKNGTPLPKGHGRLIDADKLQHEINNDKREAFNKHEVWLLLSAYNDNLLTIIESDISGKEIER